MKGKRIWQACLVAAAVVLAAFALRAWQVSRTEARAKEQAIQEILRAASAANAAPEAIGASPEPPPGPVLELGPLAQGSRAEREGAVLQLLRGLAGATALPVVATEASLPYDPGLRDRLAPLTPPSSPPAAMPCQCPPGDPLCSCY